MGVCDQELKGVLKRIPEDDLKVLKAAAISKDVVKIKQVLARYVSRRDCLDLESIKRYVVRPLVSDYVDAEDLVTYEFPLNPPPGRSLASGMYPCYSVAELVYATILEVSPDDAHERTYAVLEPVILDERFTRDERKALFLPIDKDSWSTIQELLISLIGKLDEERRREICQSLARSLRYALYCMDITLKLGFVSRISISGKLVRSCPELKSFISEGSAL